MKDFLTRLASRAIDDSMAVRPRTPTIFEPARSLESAGDSAALRADVPHTERLQKELDSGPLAPVPDFATRLEALEAIFSQVRSVGAGAARARSDEGPRALPTRNPASASPLAVPTNGRVASPTIAPAIQLTAHDLPQEPGRAGLPVGLDSRQRVPARFITPLQESRTEEAACEVSDGTNRPQALQGAIPDSPPAKDIAPGRPGRSFDAEPIQPAVIVRLPQPTQNPAPADGPAPKSSPRTLTVDDPEPALSPVESPAARLSPQTASRLTRSSPSIVVPSVRLAPLFPPPAATVTPSPIQVTIGRLEIRAAPPPAGRQRPARRPTPVVGLEEYLQRRTAGATA